MDGTSIRPCTCKSIFQDKYYGKGKRIFNRRTKANTWRCTVCGKETGKES